MVRSSRDLHWEMRTREQDPSTIFLSTLRELQQPAGDCGSCWNRTSDKDREVTLSQSCHPLCIPNPPPRPSEDIPLLVHQRDQIPKATTAPKEHSVDGQDHDSRFDFASVVNIQKFKKMLSMDTELS